MTKIVLLDGYSLGLCDLSPIEALGELTNYEFTTPDQIVERCRDAEVIIANKTIISRATMEALPKLRLIAVAATGMNNVDLDAARELGIEVRNAVGYSTHSVAEATLCYALASLRHTPYFDRYVKDGRYAASERMFCFDYPVGQLHGANWGIIGLGTIGREVARLAKSFGCNVAYTSISGVTREERYQQMSLDELLEWSDVLSIHSPLNERTRNLIGRAELRKMRRSALIINVARGGIIDEEALAEALNKGTIAGAALDVFSHEPLRHSPLYELDDPNKLLASPHTAWQSDKALKRLIKSITENIRTFFEEGVE